MSNAKRDAAARKHYEEFLEKDIEAAQNGNVVIEARFSSFCYGYDAAVTEMQGEQLSDGQMFNVAKLHTQIAELKAQNQQMVEFLKSISTRELDSINIVKRASLLHKIEGKNE